MALSRFWRIVAAALLVVLAAAGCQAVGWAPPLIEPSYSAFNTPTAGSADHAGQAGPLSFGAEPPANTIP